MTAVIYVWDSRSIQFSLDRNGAVNSGQASKIYLQRHPTKKYVKEVTVIASTSLNGYFVLLLNMRVADADCHMTDHKAN